MSIGQVHLQLVKLYPLALSLTITLLCYPFFYPRINYDDTTVHTVYNQQSVSSPRTALSIRVLHAQRQNY